MSLTREDVIRYLESLSASELGALADEVLARLGAQPVHVRRPPRMMLGAAVTEETGIPAFEVVLLRHGANKLAVMSIARSALNASVGLMDVKRLVELAPVVLVEGLPQWKARELAEELRHAGAEVEIR